MAGIFIAGSILRWNLERDSEGHRQYTISHLIETDKGAGPQQAFESPGLPLTGDMWNFGGDSDTWALCTPEVSVKTFRNQSPNEAGKWWEVTNTFSTKPRNRCQDTNVEDPLLEPPNISGSFTKSTKEAFFDRNDVPILSSSFERISLEVDDNTPTVLIEHNVASLGLSTFSAMVDTVNDSTLWGLSARKIKLSNVSWQRKYYGSCNVYYTRRFEFDINFNTFDKTFMDRGTMHVQPGKDPSNPDNFIQNKDNFSDNVSEKLLNGAGGIATLATVATITPEYYPESNFLLLGIPTSF